MLELIYIFISVILVPYFSIHSVDTLFFIGINEFSLNLVILSKST